MDGEPFRILLISDTHGDLSIIDDLARQTGAKAVIHAGDFGFYDAESANFLSTRELALQVRHSTLPAAGRQQATNLYEKGLRSLVRKTGILSELPLYLEGQRRFSVPVYAVWGNHEDSRVIARFRTGEYNVENLFILDESHHYRLGRVHLCGLGGNVIQGKKLFDVPLAGDRGKVWATLSQMERLRQAVGSKPQPGDVRVLVTHVSPGKEPLIWRLAAHIRADFSISGHMGTPYCAVWNEFSVREPDESLAMMDSCRKAIETAWKTRRPHIKPREEREVAELGMAMVRELPSEQVGGGRRGPVPRWTRSLFCINLPEAQKGYAVLRVHNEKISLETFSSGKAFLPGGFAEC